MDWVIGIVIGALVWFLIRCVLTGFFTVEQNERAVLTTFGRVQQLKGKSTLDQPMAEHLSEEHRARYNYPQVRVIHPGGPYIKMPWQKVHKVSVAIETASIAYDPEDPHLNQEGTILEAVTKDQLNIGVTGQLRYKVSEKNLYGYLFGVKNPEAHIMGYFVSILRERIANFTAPQESTLPLGDLDEVLVDTDAPPLEGISINDLRKNLNALNEQMDTECLSSTRDTGSNWMPLSSPGSTRPKRLSRPWPRSIRLTTRFPRISASPRPRPIRKSSNRSVPSRSRPCVCRPKSSLSSGSPAS